MKVPILPTQTKALETKGLLPLTAKTQSLDGILGTAKHILGSQYYFPQNPSWESENVREFQAFINSRVSSADTRVSNITNKQEGVVVHHCHSYQYCCTICSLIILWIRVRLIKLMSPFSPQIFSCHSTPIQFSLSYPCMPLLLISVPLASLTLNIIVAQYKWEKSSCLLILLSGSAKKLFQISLVISFYLYCSLLKCLGLKFKHFCYSLRTVRRVDCGQAKIKIKNIITRKRKNFKYVIVWLLQQQEWQGVYVICA